MLTEMDGAPLTLSAVVSEAGAGLERSKQRGAASGTGAPRQRRRQGSVVMMERLQALQEEFTQLREQARPSQARQPSRATQQTPEPRVPSPSPCRLAPSRSCLCTDAMRTQP